MASAAHRIAFFRQTGWMAVATGVGGMFMWLVHVPAQARMPPAEYSVFLTLLQVMNLMLIPAIGLQTVFVQQTAAAITSDQQAELRFTVWRLLSATFLLWLGMAVATWALRRWLIATLQITEPAALWFTLFIGLGMLWWPIFQGLLQGRQNFLWLGWLQTVNGLTRFAGVAVIVWWLGAYSAGAMGAALAGVGVTLSLAAWQSRSVWLGPAKPAAWTGWLAQVIPLTLGLGACQLMMSADQIVVQSIFPAKVAAWYGPPGTIGRGLVFITGALVAVMFPKIVRSLARAERTDVAALAVATTAVIGGLAGLVCVLAPQLPLQLIYKREYWTSAPLVPWFVWSILPLTLAMVLVNNLLARHQYACVSWLLYVAAAYCVTLMARSTRIQQVEPFAGFRMVIQTLGGFSLLLLAVTAWFTWGPRRRGGPVLRHDRGDAGQSGRGDAVEH